MCRNFFFMTSKSSNNFQNIIKSHRFGCDCDKCKLDMKGGAPKAHYFGCDCDKCKINMKGGSKKYKKVSKEKKLTDEQVKNHLYPDSPGSPFSEKIEDSPEVTYDDDVQEDKFGPKNNPYESEKSHKSQKGGGYKEMTGSEQFIGASIIALRYNKTKFDYITLKNICEKH